jgi:hypothetical protein
MTEVPHPRTDAAETVAVMVACREFVELVTEYQEGALPPRVEQAIHDHLALCEPCVDYLEQMRATASALRDLPAPTLSPAARDELFDVYAQLHRSPGSW